MKHLIKSTITNQKIYNPLFLSLSMKNSRLLTLLGTLSLVLPSGCAALTRVAESYCPIESSDPQGCFVPPGVPRDAVRQRVPEPSNKNYDK